MRFRTFCVTTIMLALSTTAVADAKRGGASKSGSAPTRKLAVSAGRSIGAEQCPAAERPTNGAVLEESGIVTSQPAEFPAHQIKVDNGTSLSAILKLKDHSASWVRRYYISPRRVLAIEVPDGSYEIQYVMNGRLARDCSTVISADQVMEFPGLNRLRVTENESGYGYHILKFTLYAVSGGNVRPSSISLKEFNRD